MIDKHTCPACIPAEIDEDGEPLPLRMGRPQPPLPLRRWPRGQGQAHRCRHSVCCVRPACRLDLPGGLRMSATTPPDTIEDTLDRWTSEKLAAIRARVEESVPALIDERRQLTMRLGAIEAALRAERSILQRDLVALAAAGSVAPLEEWRAVAAADAIRGALDRIGCLAREGSA